MKAMLYPPRTGMELFKIIPEGTLCELINDAIVVRPVPWLEHQQVCGKIWIEIYDKAKQENIGEVYFGPLDVYLDDKNAFQPDILFISKGRENITAEIGIIGTPDLIIEILSKHTASYDRGLKKDVYEKTGVKEYWMIHPKSKSCEGFILKDGKFEVIEPTKGSFHIQLLDLPFIF